MISSGDHVPLFLRFMASTTSFVAGVIMLCHANETKTIMGIDRQVSFADCAPYVCFVIANFVIGGYDLLLCYLTPKSRRLRISSLAIDAILIVGLTSSCSSALTVYIVEYNGNPHSASLPICNSFPKYCGVVLVAICAGYVGALVHLIMYMLKFQEGFKTMLARTENPIKARKD